LVYLMPLMGENIVTDTVEVHVGRSDPASPTAFAVERIEPMTVLDALLAIQREHDPTLGFRFSCRVSMCGTCTVRMDGRAVLACQQRIEPDATRLRVDPVAGQVIDGSLDCIGCGACWSSCGVADHRRDFLGPAALNRAMVLVADSRDAAGAERLAAVTAGDGVDRCHYIYGCTAVCPKGLDPAAAIRRLREWRRHGGP